MNNDENKDENDNENSNIVFQKPKKYFRLILKVSFKDSLDIKEYFTAWTPHKENMVNLEKAIVEAFMNKKTYVFQNDLASFSGIDFSNTYDMIMEFESKFF